MNGVGRREGAAVAVRGAGAARAIAALAMVAWLAGCASPGKFSSNEDKRKAATEAATARWAAIIKGEPERAYDEYMSEGSRRVVSRREFGERMTATAFRTASVEKVECAEVTCDVSVRVTYDHRLMRGVGNTLREKWIIEGGRLWYVWMR